MSYGVEFQVFAAQQTKPLSEQDYVSLIDALKRASHDPFDKAHSIPTLDVHVRRVPFGVHVIGQAAVFLDPQARVLQVFDVRWLG